MNAHSVILIKTPGLTVSICTMGPSLLVGSQAQGRKNWLSRSKAWLSGPHQTGGYFPRLDELCRQWEPQGPARPGSEASGAQAYNGPFLSSMIETVECRIFKQLYIHRLQDERRLPKDEVRWAINA